ncbi:formyltransferase family protein [Amycolatopsis sp.]|uniref:formyltransferase family protein n=1 Tax=Amycolatopsis sp. TaxID=37632 RepID=UPI002D806123|nr:formyltransferase family protein [Amycolatopsis sp.]HET6711239.1 formyltransferase family protein [Amycolatopsis sp.]
MTARLTAWLIGSGSLLQSCHDVLVRRGHDVTAVISTDEPTVRWAAQRGIPCARRLDAVAARPPDYLFSLANPAILTPGELRIPRRFAVNSHYGPLPAYAGLNAQHWAIMRGERTYGISWHVMSPRVDDGNLLLQRVFDVPAGATTFDLNVRCLRESVESFPSVVDKLVAGDAGVPQDRSARSYFSRATPLPRGGVLDWAVPAETTARQCRATQTGPFDNTFGVLRWVTGHAVALVRAATARPGADGPPGTVVLDDTRAPRLTTTEGILTVTRMSTVDGLELVPGDWLREQGFRSGTVTPRHDDLTAVEELAARSLAHEGFWLRELGRRPVALPIPEDAAAGELSLAESVPAAHWPAALAELTSRPVTTAWQLPDLPPLGPGLAALFATAAPITVEPGQDPAHAEAEVRRRGPYLLDIVARHPHRELASAPCPVSIGTTHLPAGQLSIRVGADGAVRLRSPVWTTRTLTWLARQVGTP